jgi:tellurite resistance protein
MADVPIGYLFIYFYGLERRIIKDYKDGGVSDAECADICQEVIRLRRIFKDNYSFNSYSLNLLDYVAITHPDILSIPDDEIQHSIYSNIFKVKLAKTVQNNEPLNPELAYAWILNHPDYNMRTPARRCSEEFKALFMKKYRSAYPEGITIKPNKTKLRLDYRPASRSISYFEYGDTNLCDPSVLSAPVKKLANIANECTDELNAYSRYLGKKDSSKEDIDALVLLPNDLLNEFENPLIKDFQSWVRQHVIANNNGICNFKDFWQQTKLPLPKRINKKEQELTCNLIEKSGYAFAPHPTLHGSRLSIEDPIVIYEADNSAKIKNSAVFDDVVVKLRLGSIIANADLKVHSSEMSFLQNLIHSNDNLISDEKMSLEAYLKWLLNSSSDFKGLKASLEKLRDNDKEVVRRMLISVALSDGKIDSNEVKEIEKLYTILGLDKSNVPADIHELSSSRSSNKAQVNRANITHGEKPDFTLDESVLELHETETKSAQNILNQIFKNEEETVTEDEDSPVAEPTLENKALAIYKIISDKDRIERAEFEKICSEYGFFVDAAIDSINEWSFDKVDAPVLEDDIDIIIDREIADELKEIEDL